MSAPHQPSAISSDSLFEYKHLPNEMFFTRRALLRTVGFDYNDRQQPDHGFLRWLMLIPRFLVILLLVLSTTPFVSAQQPTDEIPQGIEALRQSASSKTEFTLDHSMLILSSKLDSSDEDLVRVIAGVSGVSVHRYRFAGPWTYDLDALRSVKDRYHSAGWMQLVNKHDKDGMPGVTDLWIRWQDDVISNIAILVARSQEITFVEVSGSISPLDLSHLGGHFGIPKIEGGVRLPTQHR